MYSHDRDIMYNCYSGINGFEIAVECDKAIELGEILSGSDIDFIMDVGGGNRFYWVHPTTKEKEAFVLNLIRAYGLKKTSYPSFVQLWDLAINHKSE